MSESSPLISEKPLPDRHFSLMERIAATLILTAGILLICAIIGQDIYPGNSLSQMYEDYFVSPHSVDSTSGDAGYNPVDTFAYSLLLVSFVVVLSAWLRRLGIPPRDSSIIALLPWVIWAALGEVNEDGKLFTSENIGGLFVSPLIHFHVATWVVLTGWMAHQVSKRRGVSERRYITQLSFTIVLLQWVFFSPHIAENWDLKGTELLLSPLFMTPFIGLFFIIGLQLFLENFTAIEQALIQVGIGGCFIHLSGWMMMYINPLNGSEPISIIPMLCILVLPLILCVILWFMGQESLAKIHHTGLEPGIIPEGITVDDWDRQYSSTWERMEALSPRAILGLPVVLLAMYGQMVDGLATSVGLEMYGYAEKHVLSQKVIDISGTAWGFGVVKFGLAAMIWWLFASARFEHRHRHLRLLVILCLLVVGLAPGLRDVLRMTLDV